VLKRIAALVLGTAALGLLGWGQVVTVYVTVDGEPADAVITVSTPGRRVQVAYNDVHEPGVVRLQLMRGEYSLRVESGAGFTTTAHISQLIVGPGHPMEIAVELPRAFWPRETWNYYSADLHVHSSASWDGITPPDQLVAVQLSADLDLVTITDHNTILGHAPFGKAAAARGVPAILGEEITAFIGHWNAFPLHTVVDYGRDKTASDYFREAREAGAQLIQVCHPSSRLWGYFQLLLGSPEYDDSFDLVEIYNGEFSAGDEQTIATLYELWNGGHRYVAVGVSDDHDWRNLQNRTGRARTYVLVEGELTVETWLEALAAGRAYATYGPHIRLSAQGTALPGDTVFVPHGDPFELEVELVLVDVDQPRELHRAWIIRNGELWQEIPLSGHRATVRVTDTPTEPTWYAVRVFADDEDQAHSNPIWTTPR